MEDGETIPSMQMRFTHIVNKLQNLGKTISNEDCSYKILRCMTKEWQPKVTAIKESENLNAFSMITLFGKLKKHEHEITRFKSSEEEGKLRVTLRPRQVHLSLVRVTPKENHQMKKIWYSL